MTTNSAVIYCNNVYEANKTCREIGASKVFSKNLEKDEAYGLYRKVYKKKQALAKSKGGSFEIEYNMFKYRHIYKYFCTWPTCLMCRHEPWDGGKGSYCLMDTDLLFGMMRKCWR